MAEQEPTATQLAAWLGGDLDDALERLDVPAWLIDGRGAVRWANKKAIAVFGRPEGRQIIDAVGAESKRRAGAELKGALRGSKPVVNLTATVVDKRGNHIAAEIHGAALKEGGRAVGAFGLTKLGAPLSQKNVSALTPRQYDVIQLLGRGCSTDQITAELHLSRETVRNHIRGVLHALGAHSRLEAIVEARRRGLIE
jgi:DNA-binding CsgD family transcriptional regulator